LLLELKVICEQRWMQLE